METTEYDKLTLITNEAKLPITEPARTDIANNKANN
jgi:hypothetical protein